MAKFIDEIGPIHHISSLIDPNKIIRPRLKWILIYTCDWSQNVSNRNHSQRRSMAHYQKEWRNGEIQFPSFCARSLLRCVVFWFGTVQLYPYPTWLHAWHMETRLFHRHLRKTRWHVLIHCANFQPPSKKKAKKAPQTKTKHDNTAAMRHITIKPCTCFMGNTAWDFPPKTGFFMGTFGMLSVTWVFTAIGAKSMQVL